MVRILLADDYTDAADSLCWMLQTWGYYCDVAYDGCGALKLAADRRPDVALLDLRMPGLDGYALGRQLIELHPGLPVYAVTAQGSLIDVAKSKEAGFTGHLLKPVDLVRLKAILARLQPQ